MSSADAGHGLGRRPVRERGERFHHADERDARRIVGIPVAVRVDRALQTGDQLVGAPVDGPVAGGVALPPGHAKRMIVAPGATPLKLVTVGDHEAGELGAVALDVGRIPRPPSARAWSSPSTRS